MSSKKKISPEWKDWININIQRGLDKTFIFNSLLENGFSYNLVSKEMKFEPEIRQDLSNDWRAWLNENLSANHDKNDLFKILLLHGFAFDTIKSEMQYEPNIPLDQLSNPLDKISQISEVVPNPMTSDKDRCLIDNGAIEIQNSKLPIYYVDNFLSEMECNHLIKMIRSNLRPSKIASPDDDKLFRTSQTCDFIDHYDETIKRVDERICGLLNEDKCLSEPIQGQYYEIGQEFKPHTDFFEKHELSENTKVMGQRSFTVMVYLNTTRLGGETNFPHINKKFKPERGKALIWNNLNPDLTPNKFSLHHAQKVKEGYKAIITKWFRIEK